MASITLAYKNSSSWPGLLLCLLLCVPLAPLSAEARDSSFAVHEARSLLVNGVYRVSAQVEYQLGDQALDALRHGVPLVLEIRIQVYRQRDWLWNEQVAQLRQRYQLRYHALSQRYLVHSFNTGVQQSFQYLDDALQAIGALYDLPLLDARLLSPDGEYELRLRADLDIEELPTPIRLWAYLSSGWSVKSDWYTWPLKP
jgi:hypothetical protein